MNKNNEQISNELKKVKTSIETIEKLLPIGKNTKIISTQKEFKNVILDVSKFLSKSNTKSSMHTTKSRLMSLEKIPNVREACEIENEFGIPVEAWVDIKRYKKTLLP